MIYRKVEEIKYPMLHDAVLILVLRKFPFVSMYMDKTGEVCVKLSGKLSVDEVKEVILNLYPMDLERDKMRVVYDVDYSYDDGYTLVYSPDGVDLRR